MGTSSFESSRVMMASGGLFDFIGVLWENIDLIGVALFRDILDGTWKYEDKTNM